MIPPTRPPGTHWSCLPAARAALGDQGGCVGLSHPMTGRDVSGDSEREEGPVADQGGAAGSGGTAAAPTLTWLVNALLLDGRLCATVLTLAQRQGYRVSLYRADLVLNCRVVGADLGPARAIASDYALRGTLP